MLTLASGTMPELQPCSQLLYLAFHSRHVANGYAGGFIIAACLCLQLHGDELCRGTGVLLLAAGWSGGRACVRRPPHAPKCCFRNH